MKSEKLENIALGLTALGSLIVTGTLVATCVWILMFLASQLVVPVAFAQTRPAVELEAAINKEQVDGDLAAAIAAYQKIAANSSAPRDVRAKALLRLAGCYEKLGRQANNVYEQLVRDFADQPAAAQARTRLAALKKEAAGVASNIIARKITPPYFTFRTDGKSVVYRDTETGDLIAGDLAGRVKRVILKMAPGDYSPSSWASPPSWAESKDFSMVAIAFATKPDRPATIVVVKTDGTGHRELVRNDEQGKKEGLGFDSVRRLSWSWDNRNLLVSVSSEDRKTDPRFRPTGSGYVLVVSVPDGTRRRLVDVEAGYPFFARFSPDGRFVAYEVVNRASTPALSTYVVPVNGGKPSLIHEERGSALYPGLHDWTADSRYLAMTGSTAGGPALHLFPIEDGQAAGPPIPVRPGQFFAGSTTPAGALFSLLMKPAEYVAHLASLDPDGRPGSWQRLDFGGRSVATPYILDWSPDGNQIVYTARNDDLGQPGGTVIRVRNLTTGQDRELHRSPYRAACLWSAQPATLGCVEGSGDISTRGKAFSISLESGAIEQARNRPPLASYGQPSRDGQAAYLRTVVDINTGRGEFVRWEKETGAATVLDQAPPAVEFRISPDERWLLRSADLKLEVRPASGGDWRPLATVNKAVATSGIFNEFAITADSKWVVYRDVDSAGKHGLFRVPISGGAPERLGDYPAPAGSAGAIQISPDGRKILARVLPFSGPREMEWWMLENFVPPAPKR